MPRRNNRDKRYDRKDTDDNQRSYLDPEPSAKQKPVRRRKGKYDKSIYRNNDEI